jgi:hypothetical protein
MLAAGRVGDAQIGHDEAARQFDDDLVHGVFGRTETSAEITTESVRRAGGVSGLVTEAAVVAGGVDKALERRHEHCVDVGTTVNDWNIERGKEGVGSRNTLGLGQTRKVGQNIAVDLACVEGPVATREEPYAALAFVMLVPLSVVSVVAVIAVRDLLPEYDSRCLLAPADLSAELRPLLVGSPNATGIATTSL